MHKKSFFTGALLMLSCVNFVSAQTTVQTMYIDFGEPDNASRGHQTVGADINGHYWTNVKSSGNNYLYPNTSFDIVNSQNEPTGYSVFINTRFMTNGRSGGGGLLSPSADLLGDLAVATATEDYIFLESFQNYNYITFRGLDKNKGYRFHAFGSRNTDEVRAAEYLFRGENSWSGYHQMSGDGIGDGGYNGNNNKILESGVVFPDKDGNITFTIIKKNINGMVHVNAMKIEEIDGLERPNTNLSLSQSMYIDLGETENNARGHQTVGADKNGHYWNNLTSGKSSSNQIPKGTKLSLVNSDNAGTGITAETLQMMETNGVDAGGVNSPTEENLGDLAIQTATEDYVWVNDDNQRQIRFSGLDKSRCYKFYIFGSRIVDETTDRNSIYTVDGQSSWSTWLTTTGRTIGGFDADGKAIQGNVRNVAVSDYIYPDKDGNILFTFKRERGMAHVNIIKIEEYEGGERPADPREYKSIVVTGTASEDGADVTMHELRPDGNHTGIYEAYLRLQPGTYSLKGVCSDGERVTLGAGASEGSLAEEGAPMTVAETQVVRMRYDSRKNNLSVTPVVLYIKGNIVPDGTTVEYAGNGVWSQTVDLDEGYVYLFSDKYFYFAFNNSDELAVKRLSGSRTKVAMSSEGYNVENIRLNRGTYIVSLDMNNYEFTLDAPINEYRISVFGSSVANGQGASGNHGYAYLYDNLMNSRYQRKLSDNPFDVSGISIGGNTTQNLLDRYDELIHDFGRYVIIGLSMGNEGIHEATDKQALMQQFSNNMQTLIKKVRADGKIPVVMNNYTRGDYTLTDYKYIKQMNLLIHEWDVPSVNTLGAIDDGTGKWATGYMADNGHPTTNGHNEFFYAMQPSLFDALAAGKPQPVRDMSCESTLSGGDVIEFTGENILHPFTVSVRFKGGDAGRFLTVENTAGSVVGYVDVVEGGKVRYTSYTGNKLESVMSVDDDAWHIVTLTHYYAQKRVLLYVDDVQIGELAERLTPGKMYVGDPDSDVSRELSELFFWRSAFNEDEVKALVGGRMLKSSLEIYSPLSDLKGGNIANLAQSNNAAALVEKTPSAIAGVSSDNGDDLNVSTSDGTISLTTPSPVNVRISTSDGKTVFSDTVNGRADVGGLTAGLYIVNNKKVMLR